MELDYKALYEAALTAQRAAEQERDEAVKRADDLRAYEDVVNSATACDAFDDAADKWLSMQEIDRLSKAITSVFAKWSNDEIMGRFRQKMADLMHLAFVEGALVGRQAAEARATQAAAELDEALKDVSHFENLWLERAIGASEAEASRDAIAALAVEGLEPFAQLANSTDEMQSEEGRRTIPPKQAVWVDEYGSMHWSDFRRASTTLAKIKGMVGEGEQGASVDESAPASNSQPGTSASPETELAAGLASLGMDPQQAAEYAALKRRR